MPNVMGREFPYTPEGMAAAEDYRSSMGMRGGGMMGFRPVGYQDGDLVESGSNLGRISGLGEAGSGNDDYLEVFLQFEDALRNLSPNELNEYIYRNQSALEGMAASNPYRADTLQSAKSHSGFEEYFKGLMNQPYNEPDQISTTDPNLEFVYQEEYDPYGQETADTQWVEGSTGRHQGQPYNRKARGGLMSLARRRGYAG